VPPPSGWDMVKSWLQGRLWPNGNPEKLRNLGAAWFAAAKGLREAVAQASPAWSAVEDMSAPSLDQAMEQMDLVANTAESVAQDFDALGGSCRDWASAIEDAHRQLISLVAIAVLAIVAFGAAGGLIGSIEPGGGTVVGAGVGGGAGAALTISRILTVLVGLDTTALALTAAGSAAVAVVAAADTAINNLQPLLQAEASVIGNGGGGVGRPKDWKYWPAPKEKVDPPGFKGFQRDRPKTPKPDGGKRARWKDKDGNILEWDYQHGNYEKYDSRGRHMGEYDTSGNQTKPANPSRKVQP
jgi:hypothetical protein